MKKSLSSWGVKVGALVLLTQWSAGCVAWLPLYPPAGARAGCEERCEMTGMRLSNLVIVQGSVGCVCAPPDEPKTSDAGGAATGGVMISLMNSAKQNEESAARRSYTP